MTRISALRLDVQHFHWPSGFIVFRISSIRRHGYYIFFAARFCVAGGYYSRVAFISLESLRHQLRLDEVRMSETVMVALMLSVVHTQPCSSAIICENDFYSTNDPSASLVIVVRNYLHT